MEHRQSSHQGQKSPQLARTAPRLLVPLPPGDYLALVAALPIWRPAFVHQASVQERLQAYRSRRRLLCQMGSAALWALHGRSSHAAIQRITDTTYATYSMQPRPPTSPVGSASSRAFSSGSWLGRVATWWSH
ncbi:uncharacterized protein LOC144137933 [Haemaphysalis longicornis]